jgi:hypothetical protein
MSVSPLGLFVRLNAPMTRKGRLHEDSRTRVLSEWKCPDQPRLAQQFITVTKPSTKTFGMNEVIRFHQAQTSSAGKSMTFPRFRASFSREEAVASEGFHSLPAVTI